MIPRMMKRKTAAQYCDLSEAAFEREIIAGRLLYFTGQRIGDVCQMRWGDIRDGHIYVRQTKTGKLVEPPLTAELQAELDRTPRRSLLILDGTTDRQLRDRLQAFTAARKASA